VVLPDGEHRELWIADGVIRTEPVAGAETVDVGGWLLPGLVDAHCHIGLDADGPVGREETEEQALTDRSAGALLVRDAGSPSDTRWIDDREDLPRVIRAGRHIARPKRYLRNYADEVEPESLVAAVERQVAAGDGWVKLVGDWIDRTLGDLAPLWPQEALDAAVARAHELGARVTAHVFGPDALPGLLAAGVDGIEHGTGLDEATIAVMAERQVALVPTLVQLENFESFAAAGERKFPTYAKHMRALYASRLSVLADAYDAGVPIYAGTDAGGFLPHGLIGTEMEMLGRVCGADTALGAGSWRAREWLGRPSGLRDGDPADLVVVDADPRTDLRVLRAPRRVILRGRVVA
jgi:imidazolonepropionase-like amidohydrolase